MGHILTFNPETDFALASGVANYTPPARIVTLRRRLSLLPVLYASSDDIIVTSDFSKQELERLMNSMSEESCDTTIPYLKIVKQKQIKVLSADALSAQINEGAFCAEDFEISPWGWNASIRNSMVNMGIPDYILPSKSYIDALRELSHRRNTIKFNRFTNTYLGVSTELPVELKSTDEAMMFLKENPGCYFKSPWSSSGRGVMVGGTLNDTLSEEWLHGAIKRQGSVMVEIGHKRILDFATEWEYTAKEPSFKGLSLFSTTAGGSYNGNLIASQNILLGMIQQCTHTPVTDIIEAQRAALRETIGSGYNGPLGIDCCIDNSGTVYPCLEINLRRTMGHVSLSLPIGKSNEQRIFTPGQESDWMYD